MTSTETMRDQLRERLKELLAESQDPTSDMEECSRLLSRDLDMNVQTSDEQEFLRDMLGNGVGAKLANLAIQSKMNPESAETPVDLVLRLLPSDDHLA